MVMQARDLVAASLVALDRDEAVCVPSLDDIGLWEKFVEAEAALAANVSQDRPARRYL